MDTQGDDKYAYALSSNAAWAGYKAHQNASFFPTLSAGQAPEILWLGCSDSRCPETTILGLQPGDVFVHRNIANIVSPTDINSEAVIEYAVVFLKVKHIVVCGHTSCGGAAAAMGGAKVGGVLDTWLAPLKALKARNKKELEALKDPGAQAVRLAELNVQAGVETLLANFVVEDAIKERGLMVHGLIYDLSCGKLRDLLCGNEKIEGETYLAEKEAAAAAEEKIVEVRGKHAMLVFDGGNATMSAV